MGRSSENRLRLPALAGVLAAAATLALAACGGGESGESAFRNADEPEGEFPVRIRTSEFPTRQRLGGSSQLLLGIQNAGEETIPDLTVMIFTDPNADDAFSVRSDEEGLAVPTRPVWVLEYGFPKFVGSDAPAEVVAGRRRVFSFGPVEPGQLREIVWKVTAVQPGTYTLSYRVAAGTGGKAVAVTPDGSEPQGEFVVRITDVPPQTRVNDQGEVVPIRPSDIIGRAGTPRQKGELGHGR